MSKRSAMGTAPPSPGFATEELVARVRWHLRIRWLATALAAVAVMVACTFFPPGTLPLGRLLGVLLVLALSNALIGFVLVPKCLQGCRWLTPLSLVKGQILLDLGAYTLLLHWSGGAENPAAIYYVLQVIIAGVLLSRRWAFGCAALCSLLYGLVLTLEGTRAVPHVHLPGIADPTLYQNSPLLALVWLAQSASFAVAAYLASAVVQKLRQREQELTQANLSCELRSAELAAANRRLQDMARGRESFLRYVTHELRAPIAAIQSYLRLLRDGYVEPARVPEIAQRAEQRAAQALALIADLLDLSQVEHEQTFERRELVDPGASLVEAVEAFRPQAKAKGVQLTVSLAPDLPVVLVNPRHLALLWNNLIGNAIKYTPAGGQVMAQLDVEGESLRFQVRDSGIGISPEDKEHIFEEFYRGERARRFDPHGSGLGLAIVKRLVDRYGGQILVDSQEGKGTTFTVLLPFASLRASCLLPTGREARPRPGLPRTLV